MKWQSKRVRPVLVLTFGWNRTSATTTLQINDVGVIYASAQIHSNWAEPKDGRIEAGGTRTGRARLRNRRL